MLIGFRLANFRSFMDEQAFTFATSSDRLHEATHCIRTGMKVIPRIAKSAVVFGPNGSGKTNLLAAFDTLRDLMLHSTGYSDKELGERHSPFQFGASSDAPTQFDLDVLLDGVRYRYTLAYDSRRIRFEKLLVYRTGKSQRWFERHFDETSRREVWAPFSPHFNGPREMWRKATRPQALFLTVAAQLNCEQLAPLMRWVEHHLQILFASDLIDSSRSTALIQSEDYKARVLALLRAVDIPVADARIADGEAASFQTSAARYAGKRPLIEFLHAHAPSAPVWMDLLYEAAGTHRLFALFGALLAAVDRGNLLLLDDFDTNLHPLIARYVLQIVNDPRTSTHGAQLLLVSHNSTLMSLDILRRDGIWLMQRDARHASMLSQLARRRSRRREMMVKSYLVGHYGAIPAIRPLAAHPEGDVDGEEAARRVREHLVAS